MRIGPGRWSGPPGSALPTAQMRTSACLPLELAHDAAARNEPSGENRRSATGSWKPARRARVTVYWPVNGVGHDWAAVEAVRYQNSIASLPPLTIAVAS